MPRLVSVDVTIGAFLRLGGTLSPSHIAHGSFPSIRGTVLATKTDMLRHAIVILDDGEGGLGNYLFHIAHIILFWAQFCLFYILAHTKINACIN